MNKDKSGQFCVGNVPWNKGLKGFYTSPKTQFRKGCVPANKVIVGTIVRKITGRKGNVKNFIKVAEPDKWKALSLYMWEARFGRLIPGDIIRYLDGDSLNDGMDNILAMPRSEHCTLCRWGIKRLTKDKIEYLKSRYSLRMMAEF